MESRTGCSEIQVFNDIRYQNHDANSNVNDNSEHLDNEAN